MSESARPGREIATADAVDGPTERKIEKMFYRYAKCLDDDRLEEWPSFFVESGRYIIHPRIISMRVSKATGSIATTAG